MIDDKKNTDELARAEAWSRFRAAKNQDNNILDLSNLGLSEFPTEFFEEDCFEIINLSNNMLVELPDQIANLHRVSYLDISGNKFKSLPVALGGMHQLLGLDVGNNNIAELPVFFEALSSLRHLVLSKNELAELPDSIGDVTLLEFLDCTANQIGRLPTTFQKLVKLRSIKLGGNKLEEIPQYFSEFKNLKILDFSDNALDVFPAAVQSLNGLRLIDFSQNRISELPAWIGEQKELEVLYLSENEINTIPDSIARLSNLTNFSISRNKLSSLPSSIGELTKLTTFFCVGNKLARLPKNFSNLTNLNRVSLSDNGFVTFPEELVRLSKLEVLMFSRNDIVFLPEEISNLLSLKRLDVWGNSLRKLPESISLLSNLEWIDVANNRLRDLPDLSRLQKLRHLDVSINNLTKLFNCIGELKDLEHLDAAENELADLPDSIGYLGKLKVLCLHGNPALELPNEILGPRLSTEPGRFHDEVKSPSSILSYYFARRSGSRPLNEMKVVVVGRGSAGKTSIIKRLIIDEFDPNEVETPGIEITPWVVQISSGEDVRLHAWDFGGQEILHATHQFFFSERCLYLLVLTGRDGQQQLDAEYWLQLVSSFGGDSKVVVVLNKSTQHRFDLNRQTLLEKYPGRIVAFCETDCQTELGIPQLRNLIIEQIAVSEHRTVPFPEVWFNIKEALAGTQADYLSWDRFVDLCREMGEFSEERQIVLAGYLHALGIALNYSNDIRLVDTHVLNPRWVTEGVYSLLRNRQGFGSPAISESDLSSILPNDRYPVVKHHFLLRLMELYQLCFKLPQQDGMYLIPELLPRNQPEISSFVEKADISFFYLYSVLPEGLLPRFIVQTHRMSEGCSRWRSGVQLSWEGCEAIVVADSVDRLVKIYIRGVQARSRDFLAVIRQKFDEQHQILKGISVSEKIPLRGTFGKLIDYRDLIKREARNENWFYPDNMDVQVSVRALLDGVETPSMREERRHATKDGENSQASVINNYNFDSNITQLYKGDMMSEENRGTVQNISGGVFNSSAVVASANSFNWQANIARAENDELKLELERLTNLVVELLKTAPPESVDVVNRNMAIFTEQATAPKPDTEYLAIAAKRLTSAATAVASVSGPILDTVEKVMKLLS